MTRDLTLRQFLLAVFALFLSIQALAMDLDQAKAKGLVGEQRNGYLGLVVQNEEAKQTVEQVNQKRKERYQAIADKHDIPLEVVEKRAAQKAYEITKDGHFIENENGEFIKK